MKTTYEIKALKNTMLSTLGYGFMWLFIALLLGVLPFFTANGHTIYYFAGAAALVVAILKFVSWFKISRAL